MKKRFTDEQIILMIKEQDAGEKTADVCRRHGISAATFYKYKSKEPSDAKRLRALEDENGKLKKLLAEQMLDNTMLQVTCTQKARNRFPSFGLCIAPAGGRQARYKNSQQ